MVSDGSVEVSELSIESDDDSAAPRSSAGQYFGYNHGIHIFGFIFISRKISQLHNVMVSLAFVNDRITSCIKLSIVLNYRRLSFVIKSIRPAISSRKTA